MIRLREKKAYCFPLDLAVLCPTLYHKPRPIFRGARWSQAAEVNLKNVTHSHIWSTQMVKRQNMRVRALPCCWNMFSVENKKQNTGPILHWCYIIYCVTLVHTHRKHVLYLFYSMSSWEILSELRGLCVVVFYYGEQCL